MTRRIAAAVAIVVALFLFPSAHGRAIAAAPLPGQVALGFSKAATSPWQDTGLILSAGSTIYIAATGAISVNNFATETPAGDPSCVPDTSFTAPGLTCWSLIGRIDGGRPFEIGTGRVVRVPLSGQLYLGVNDQVGYFGDNSGSWTVITAVPSPASLIFVVPATQPWTSPLVALPALAPVNITATGPISVNNFATEAPAGDPTCVPDASFTAPGLTCWSLIGVFSGGRPFEIGANRSFVMPVTRYLSLGVNDQAGYFGDNAGQWVAHITVY